MVYIVLKRIFMLKNFQTHEFLNGQNFSKIADVIFALNVPNDELGQFNKSDFKIISENNEFTGLKLKNLNLKNGDIIFCNSSYLNLLFKYLKRLKKVTSLTLITSQSDFSVTEKIFLNKPTSIKKWYAVNVAYEDSNLIPIPLGLANNYSPKNIRINDLINFNFKKENKENKLYVNVRKSTNLKERENIESLFGNKDWVVIKEPNLTINQYLEDLHKYRFIFCPWGNGIDTHRMWEALYCGSVPVTKTHVGLSFGNLPIISFDNFNDLTIENLIDEFNKTENDLEALNIKHWDKFMKSEINLNDEFTENIKEINYIEYIFWKRIEVFRVISSKLKIIRFYFRKIIKKLNNFL